MENNMGSSSKQRNKDLEDWTKQERLNLLQALKRYGSDDVAKLRRYVRTKSEDQIKEALEFYRNRAFPETETCEPTKRKATPGNVPLAAWAGLLTNGHGMDELQSDIASVLRIIAQLEDRPPSSSTEDFDFEKIYLMLADAMDGKTLQYDSKVRAVVEDCILKTAVASKKLNHKDLIGSINMTEKDAAKDVKPAKTQNEEYLRTLLAQKNYNPLNISADACKIKK